MDDLKPSFVFVGVDGEDLSQEEFEVKEEKPVFIVQSGSTHCEPARKETKKRRSKKNFKCKKGKLRSSARLANKKGITDINRDAELASIADSSGGKQVNVYETGAVNNENHKPQSQITSVMIKAEKCFNSVNDNDLVSTLDSVDELIDEIADPLENNCDVETTHNIKQEPTCNTEAIPKLASSQQSNFKHVQVDIRLLAPYIKKLCAKCEEVTELVLNDTFDKCCNLCRKPVTYCCKLCLKMGGLKDLYIHVFKSHTDKFICTKDQLTPSYKFLCSKCGVHYLDSVQLKKHDQVCNMLPNLFCQFCPAKMKVKHEMRQHMINLHMRQHRMNTQYLEEMLDDIIAEGDAVMALLTRHYGYCKTCKKHVSLINRPIYCLTCSSKLIYQCLDSACSSHVYTQLTSLHDHLRWHIRKGFTKDPLPPPSRCQRKPTPTTSIRKSSQPNKVKLCHLCGTFEGNIMSLRKHMTAKHPEIVLCKCDLCGKNLKNVHLWKKHQKGYCPIMHQKLQCEHCQFRSFKKRRLKRHLKNFHTYLYLGKRLQCNKCGITWAGLQRLKEHERECSGEFKVERAKQKESWDRRRIEISCE